MMKLQFQPRMGTIVAVFGKPLALCCFLRRSSALDLDSSYQICDTLRPISRAVAGKLPLIHRQHEEKLDAPY